ncbi:hypothetical protein GCM10017744_047760 [Streptomyces antimycoticus]
MPAERPREHAPPVAAARRRLRADRARQLADLLRHQVLTGGFPGGVLPLEDALGQGYGASRNTVRQALDLLRAELLVERQPGVGTVVVAEKYPSLPPLRPFPASGGCAPSPRPGLRPGLRSAIAGGAEIAPPWTPLRKHRRRWKRSGRARAPSWCPCPAGGSG